MKTIIINFFIDLAIKFVVSKVKQGSNGDLLVKHGPALIDASIEVGEAVAKGTEFTTYDDKALEAAKPVMAKIKEAIEAKK